MSDEAARAAHAAAAQWARDHNLPGFMAEWDRLDPDERDYFSVVGGAVLAADPDRAALEATVQAWLPIMECVDALARHVRQGGSQHQGGVLVARLLNEYRIVDPHLLAAARGTGEGGRG